MLSAGTIVALILVGASATYGLVLVAFAKARRRLPLSWFALTCLTMGIYSVDMVLVTVPNIPDSLIYWTGPVGYTVAAIFTLSATRHVYFRAKKSYSKSTRILEWGLVAVAVASLIPGLVFEQGVPRQWVALQTTYRFPHSTVVLAACASVIAIGFANLIRTTWLHLPKPVFFSCCCLVIAGSQDIAISLYFYESFFAAATGAIVFLVALALDEAVYWGDEAKQLSDLKLKLEQRVQERTEELSETLGKLARSERLASLGRLAASVGHEINNPITYVLLNLELLRDCPNIEKTALEHAIEGAQRVAGIVAQLRIFSRTSEPKHQVVDVDDVLRTAVRTVEHKLLEHHRLEVDSQPSVAYVLGDHLRLTQLFTNLLSNSIESLKDDGKTKQVCVEVSKNDDDILISIRDQGSGIPTEIREHLFEPFTTGRANGLGLGLAIAQSIADEHDGNISVESGEGEGSKFTVKLPCSQPPLVVAETDLPEETVQLEIAGTPRILIVDDEPGLTLSLKKLLPKFHVTISSSGEDALAKMRAELFDGVVCDLVMPGLSGLEVFDRAIDINAQYADRFILMSGGVPSSEMRQRLNLSDTPFLSKPFRPAELRNLLSTRFQNIEKGTGRD